MKRKYLKVMFGNISGANSNLTYKLDEINEADNWNPHTEDPREMGGFNFSTEDKILRWLVRGDTIYDVTVPKDADIIDCYSPSAPHGVFRSNKIIISNPRKVTDTVAMELYKKSNLPEKSYYKALAGLAIRGHINTAKQLIKDKVNKDNIKLVLSEIEDFVKPENTTVPGNIETYNEVMKILKEIENE